MTTSAVSRGDIFLLENKNATGAEMQKNRPCVIIQNDIANCHSSTVVVALITSYKFPNKVHPFQVFIKARETGLLQDSLVACNHIQTVDKGRLLKKLGAIPEKTMREVDMTLIRHLDLGYS